MHYIYKITNIINQKIYIGQSKKPNIRWSQHKLQAKRDKPSQIVNRAMKKYGIENFTFEVIACCLDQDAANEAEELIIRQESSQNHGYNLSNGGSVAPKTDAWKQHMSQIMSGRLVSEDTRKKISESLVGRYVGDKHVRFGVPHTDEIKNLIREKRATQIKEKGLPWPKGSRHSEKSKLIMSIKSKGVSKPVKQKKINMDIANQIREEYNSMSPTYQELSEKYDLCVASVCQIVNNKRWIVV